ncbi:MAG: matrixin family metalloprotease [Cyanobacteria bacterium P01_H01_bin.74]
MTDYSNNHWLHFSHRLNKVTHHVLPKPHQDSIQPKGPQSKQNLSAWQKSDESKDFKPRWPDDKKTLLVFTAVNPHNPSGFSEQGVKSALENACSQWELASQGRFTFGLQFLSDNACSPEALTPDILIAWQSETTVGRQYEVGHAKRHLVNESIVQVEITLILNPAIDRELNADEKNNRLTATLLHELGHALGLEHSMMPEDVMHHRGWQNTQLTETDRSALRVLYGRTNPSYDGLG